VAHVDRRYEVAHVRGIERAAEHTDAFRHPPIVASGAGGGPAGRGAGIRPGCV
jgi:hypothetical protein